MGILVLLIAYSKDTVMINRKRVVVFIYCLIYPLTLGLPIKEQPEIQIPFLSFPFAHFIGNPCGFMTSVIPNFVVNKRPGQAATVPSVHTKNAFSKDLQPMRALASDGTPLSEQVLEFLYPFKEYYANQNYTSEERQTLIQELTLILHESKHRNNHIYPPSELHQCDGLQLQSLPHNLSLFSSSEDVQLNEIYYGLAIVASHLHLMIRDINESHRFCPNENRAQHQNIGQLTGKLETMMCLLLNLGSNEMHANDIDFFAMANRVLQTKVNRFYDCSTRELRGCLVIRYANRIFGAVQLLISNKKIGF